ncbi:MULTISPECIES: LLM class F420-dependent oxidoreductase [Actinomycetes]|uniref:LLM class F420-dependent oxidoreductase n=1 Tax=Actinomycetes TaxID=1760 RepID=UPI0006901401|nr:MULTISPECIES: LLM class F420-dependent oxidoreductase [Actinomycetes]
MRLGLHALGIGSGARREIIDAVAVAAEAHGFATLWAGEHVVMVDEPASRFSYTDNGAIAVPAAADWLDPMITLSFAAAATHHITLATGVVLLPEHNPVIMAKQVASLDRLSNGRLVFGIGIGWCREEFQALGVPFAGRAARTADYVEAMRTLWHTDPASYHCDVVDFENIRVNPKPLAGSVPIILGGNSDAAMTRIAAWGDGWYGFNLDNVATVADRLALLDRLCRDNGRNRTDLTIAVAMRDPDPDQVQALQKLGVDEVVLVESPPSDPAHVAGWVDNLAHRWIPIMPSRTAPSAPTTP